MSEPTVFLSAGEQSGDIHGAELARELRRRIPGVRLFGLGGSHMAAAGVELLAALDRLAVLGFSEVVRHVPDLVRLQRETRKFLLRRGVDLLVPIDYPGFNLRLAAFAHARGLKVLYYIAPQVWAWRSSRARRIARDVDLVCAVLPFEPAFLERYGVRVRFVGHPLLDAEDRAQGPTTPRTLAPGPPVLGLFPGSRVQEIRRLLPPFLEAARLLTEEIPEMRIRVARAPDLPLSVYEPYGSLELNAPEEVTRRAMAAVTKSGTITLQLAIAGVPMVVGYRVSRLSYGIARRLVHVEHIALVNLVAGERLVPELVQEAMNPKALARAARPLVDPTDESRARTVQGLAAVRQRLGSPGAAGRVADACVELLETS